MSEQRRLRVLISAYACQPHRGSEPGVGWHWCEEAAREHEVWALVWTKFRRPIEQELRDHPRSHLNFVFRDLPRWLAWTRRLERLHYLLWQLWVLPTAYRLHRRHRLDVIHHVTFNTLEGPGFLWLLDAPFVWGPVGGGQVPHPALRRYFGRGWLFEALRRLRKRLIGWNPVTRLAVRRAAYVLAANGDTARLLAAMKPRRLLPQLETAVSPEQIVSTPRPSREDGEYVVLWAGQLVRRKAAALAVDAFAALRQRGVPARLLIAGDGPLRNAIESQVGRLELQADVELLGELPYAAMMARYRQADVFLFTSLQDTSGNVVLEAMAQALPVVTLDQHGAGEIVTEDCGVKVAIEGEQQVIEALADGLQRLTQPALRRRMGSAARERVAALYTWERKGELASRLYRDAARPELEAPSAFAEPLPAVKS